MSNRSIVASTSLLVASLAIFGSACDVSEGSTPEDSNIRHIHFDATDINDVLHENPDTRFLVDLREGNVVHFDQDEEDFDFSAFDAICPSMPAPVPFPQLIDMLDLQVEDEAAWSMQSTLTETDEYRGGCTSIEIVCDENGQDCMMIRTHC
ncbi:MAG: hypothetical protein AAF799_25910 [Myxococcota bacterium]